MTATTVHVGSAPPEAQLTPAAGRVPPQDIGAEQCVLGGLLLSKDVIADVVEILRSGDFYRPAHSTIFDTVLDLYGRGEPADPITVAAALADAGALARVGGAGYLHTCVTAVPTAANAAYYARIVAERAVMRRLLEAGTRIVQLAYGTGAPHDVDDVVDLAQQMVYDVADRRSTEDFAVLEQLLQPTLDEVEAAGGQVGLMRGVPTGFSDLDRLLGGLHPGQLIMLAGRPGFGKALALDTPLPTPNGWTTMGEVEAGDRLIGADGLPTTGLPATEVMYGRPCYEVEFSDGSVIIADGSHEWLTHTRYSRRYAKAPAVRTTDQISETLRADTADQRLNHSVSNARPIRLPERDLPLPPYTLGAWLGDGHSAGARITTADLEILGYIEADGLVVTPSTAHPMMYGFRLPSLPDIPNRGCVVCGVSFRPKALTVQACGRSCAARSHGLAAQVEAPCPGCGERLRNADVGVRQCMACVRTLGSVNARLRTLGALHNKHIPTLYLRASEPQRRALLAGLLDTDGTVGTPGNVQYTSTSQRLAQDVHELVTSLGYRCTINAKKVAGRRESSSTAYTVSFSTADAVFRLTRKQAAHKKRCRTVNSTRNRLRYIVDVRPVPSVPVRCVQVDNAGQLYIAGRSMIPTHNSTLGLDVARAAAIANGLPSAIFSLEMSKIEITMRLLSAEARVALHALRSGHLSDDEWTRLAGRMGEISDAPLYVDDTPNMTLMEIRAKARRLRQRHDLRLVVVDYLQLMTSPKRVESRQQEVSELSRGLKLLAKELEIPVIAVSQLNRGPEQRTDKRPQLSDLRESGSLEQDSDVVILLHREDYYDKESPRAGEADFIVAKHRNGPTDTITVAAQLHLSRFVDMAVPGA